MNVVSAVIPGASQGAVLAKLGLSGFGLVHDSSTADDKTDLAKGQVLGVTDFKLSCAAIWVRQDSSIIARSISGAWNVVSFLALGIDAMNVYSDYNKCMP